MARSDAERKRDDAARSVWENDPHALSSEQNDCLQNTSQAGALTIASSIIWDAACDHMQPYRELCRETVRECNILSQRHRTMIVGTDCISHEEIDANYAAVLDVFVQKARALLAKEVPQPPGIDYGDYDEGELGEDEP